LLGLIHFFDERPLPSYKEFPRQNTSEKVHELCYSDTAKKSWTLPLLLFLTLYIIGIKRF